MKKFVLFYFFSASFSVFSQDIAILQGDLATLKGQSDIKVEFDYENIAIEGGGTEKEYRARKFEYLNNKEAGRGDKFERTWVNYRADYFEPRFTETFVKHSKLTITEKAKYTLIFKATRFDDEALLVPPNEEARATNKRAVMDGEAWIVETTNRDNVVAKISMKKIPGRDYTMANGSYNSSSMANYDVRVRLSFTYAKAGKELGAYIVDRIK